MMSLANTFQDGNRSESENVSGGDLTTTEAPFIESAARRGELFIQQPYSLYSERNHNAWRQLFQRMKPRWEQYANPRFLQGIAALRFDCGKVPRLSDVNKFLEPLTGFQAKAVSGYVPAYLFFDCLRRKEFPTTITIRSHDHLGYLPEPDIFHDIAGHVPMHTDRAFADTLVRFGECAHTAATIAQGISNEDERIQKLSSIIKGMARFFWFTVEYGLMKRPGMNAGLCVYGSGLLSSYDEIKHCIESEAVQRYPVQMEWLINQAFEIDHHQPLLFFVDSFEHLFGLVDELERWMKDGRLNNVAPGAPEVSEQDLKSFLEGA